MQYLEEMVPQQNMTAQEMQMSAKMERIAIHETNNAVIPKLPATRILNSTYSLSLLQSLGSLLLNQ